MPASVMVEGGGSGLLLGRLSGTNAIVVYKMLWEAVAVGLCTSVTPNFVADSNTEMPIALALWPPNGLKNISSWIITDEDLFIIYAICIHCGMHVTLHVTLS